MAIKKESLNNFLPNGFETLNQEGYKENFSADKISTGYEKDVPDIVSGPNLNNLIDVIGKNTNTLNSYVEYLNSLSVNKTPIVDSNNQLNSTQIGLKVYSATETYLLNDLVTTIKDGKVHFYRSLVANNKGHDLTDEQYWEEVKLGGGSGLEVCDIGMALYVDETKGLRRYLNGQIVDINTNTQAFLNRLKDITTLHPSLLCTEEEWQTAKTMSAFGQVGKFVFNYSGENIVSVRLPRVVNVQGLFDLQNLGMTVSAGLPTHTHTRGTMEISGSFPAGRDGWGTSGAFSQTSWATTYSGGKYNMGMFDFHASRSWTGSTSAPDNSIYGASNTVQPEAIQYPYFIQIATGSETEANIVNTLENVNGFTLLESKYSDKPLYNESWLLSNGQWNAKAVYPTAYEALQVEYNTGIEAGTTVTLPSGVSYTKRGLSVKLSTETYTDYDFVLNTTDETFRLPLKTKLASGNAVVGNGMTLGLTNGSSNYGLIQTSPDNTPTQLSPYSTAYGLNVGSEYFSGRYSTNVTLGITTDPTKSGIETSDSNLYLYFYVGDIDQNHGIVNMGRIGEMVTNCITRSDCKAYVTDTYVNGTSGYRTWSDGYCEQWGTITSYSSSNGVYKHVVTLLKPYKDANYQVYATPIAASAGENTIGVTATGRTATQITFATASNYTNGTLWKAEGYIA